jgi:DNA repair protein RadC
MNTYVPVIIQIPQVREATSLFIRGSNDIFEYCSDICKISQESLQTLAINSKNRLISRRLITLGVLNASLSHPREVFRGAIEDSAHSIILIHNHPSGDLTPSAEDIRITRQMVEAGRILDIPVIDHCILSCESGTCKIMSMRETGIVYFA